MHIVQLRIVCAGRHEDGWSRSLTAYMGVLLFSHKRCYKRLSKLKGEEFLPSS